MSVLKGDYIGFTYNGIHSSELGLIRVSDGSRYNEFLLPAAQDKTVQVPGGDGTYFFGSYYTSKPLSISVAFDSVTEKQLRRIKQVFGDKKIHQLIFDEAPYKVYSVKVTGTASIKYLAFDEGKQGSFKERVYKGEGEIQFTAYNPFAKSLYQTQEEYARKGIENISEWSEASGILSEAEYGSYNHIVKDNQILLYNPGDLEADWVFTLKFNDSNNGKISPFSLSLDDKILVFGEIERKDSDEEVRISSKTNLLEGYFQGFKTGNVYNSSLLRGEFFKIPVNSYDKYGEVERKAIVINHAPTSNILSSIDSKPLKYDYYYF